jgi:hypothetical protein
MAVNRTPAGQVFVQETAGLDWRRCHDLAALRRHVLADLSRFLLDNTERYGITVIEGQRLHNFIAALEKAATAEQSTETLAPKPAGAGGGGVILAPGKDEPRGARLVGERG